MPDPLWARFGRGQQRSPLVPSLAPIQPHAPISSLALSLRTLPVVAILILPLVSRKLALDLPCEVAAEPTLAASPARSATLCHRLPSAPCLSALPKDAACVQLQEAWSRTRCHGQDWSAVPSTTQGCRGPWVPAALHPQLFSRVLQPQRISMSHLQFHVLQPQALKTSQKPEPPSAGRTLPVVFQELVPSIWPCMELEGSWRCQSWSSEE